MQQTRVFDLPHYRHLDEARITFLRPVLMRLMSEMQLLTALDVGCGLGNFARLLKDVGFHVFAIDGRRDNVEEAGRRYEGIDFKVADVEDSTIPNLGVFDLVLCVGLLYHLENPFRAIRNLSRVSSKVVLIESMCTSESEPALRLRDEEPSEDQGLRHIAFIPSESCLSKMLYASGFSFVYRFTRLPDHPHFQASMSYRRVRTLLAASKVPLAFNFLQPLSEPLERIDPWARPWSKVLRQWSRRIPSRIWRPIFTPFRRTFSNDGV